jgi:hypothetical protein
MVTLFGAVGYWTTSVRQLLNSKPLPTNKLAHIGISLAFFVIVFANITTALSRVNDACMISPQAYLNCRWSASQQGRVVANERG